MRCCSLLLFITAVAGRSFRSEPTDHNGWPVESSSARRKLRELQQNFAGGRLQMHADEEAIQGCFIVRMKQHFVDGYTTQSAHAHRDLLIADLSEDPTKLYNSAVEGFSGCFSPSTLRQILADAEVIVVEEDVRVNVTAQANPVWGLDRIDQAVNNPDRSFDTGTLTGAGVDVYIIDTGVNGAHQEYSSRLLGGKDFVGDGYDYHEDCDGHGTHCAGTAVGTTYGVAKQANLFGVRVLDCRGGGSLSGVIAGLDWVVENAQQRGNPSIASMSLGAGFSPSMNAAVNAATVAGVVVVVAAGNENMDACATSPASAGSAITVASTTDTDARSWFSNYGSCVDLFAPGSDIKSAWVGSESATETISGTSMAAPHVSGAAALVMQQMLEEGALGLSVAPTAATGTAEALLAALRAGEGGLAVSTSSTSTSSSSSGVSTNSYSDEFVNVGFGRCVLSDGSEPQHWFFADVEASFCQLLCTTTQECSGYNHNSYSNCIVWVEGPLSGNSTGEVWGDAECSLRQTTDGTYPTPSPNDDDEFNDDGNGGNDDYYGSSDDDDDNYWDNYTPVPTSAPAPTPAPAPASDTVIEVTRRLLAAATANTVTDAQGGSPNLLLRTANYDGPTSPPTNPAPTAPPTTPPTTAEVQLEMYVKTAAWGGEVSWWISCDGPGPHRTDGCVGGGTLDNDGQFLYGNDQEYTLAFSLAPGEHTLQLVDSYGDGWHGGWYELRVAGSNSSSGSSSSMPASTTCASDYGTSDICCGQEGSPSSITTQCPSDYPVCQNYVHGSTWGTCFSSGGGSGGGGGGGSSGTILAGGSDAGQVTGFGMSITVVVPAPDDNTPAPSLPISPTPAPTTTPTSTPTAYPTFTPTTYPSTSHPTPFPTTAPTYSSSSIYPTHTPTSIPSNVPPAVPSSTPTGTPTSTTFPTPAAPTPTPTPITPNTSPPTPTPATIPVTLRLHTTPNSNNGEMYWGIDTPKLPHINPRQYGPYPSTSATPTWGGGTAGTGTDSTFEHHLDLAVGVVHTLKLMDSYGDGWGADAYWELVRESDGSAIIGGDSDNSNNRGRVEGFGSTVTFSL